MRTIKLGCEWCAYATAERPNRIPPAPLATQVIDTAKGLRHVCAAHAKSGRWEPRARRGAP